MKVSTAAWGVLWHSENRYSGIRRHLVWEHGKPVLFRTRHLARQRIWKAYRYIKHRKDLRAEPHGWRVPTAVRVTITTSEEAGQ